MLYVSLTLCIIVCTFFVGRFFAAKTRLVEQAIESAISRKLSTSPMNIELGQLREQNAVMRNLLIDMLENEGAVTMAGTTSPAEQNRAMKAKIQRRREICGEAVFALQQAETVQSKPYSFRMNG